MQIFKFLIYTFLALILVIGCGGNKDNSETDAAAEATVTVEQAQPEFERPTTANNPKDKMTVHNPNIEKVNPNANIKNRGPEMVPDELNPGSCEFSAYWFAEYFTSGDSTNAYSLCTDSMEMVVRTILQLPDQISTMNHNRQTGYKIESISIVDTEDPDFCRACITASFMNESRDDCNFYFVNVNGDWLLYAFGEELK